MKIALVRRKNVNVMENVMNAESITKTQSVGALLPVKGQPKSTASISNAASPGVLEELALSNPKAVDMFPSVLKEFHSAMNSPRFNATSEKDALLAKN